MNGANCGRATCATMGDEVHQLTGWQALKKKKKKQAPRGSPACAAGVWRGLPSAGSVRFAVPGDQGREAGSGEGGLAAWGAARGFSFFTTVTAQSGTALARSLRAQGPLETCVTATASHMQLGADFGGQPAFRLPPSFPTPPPVPGSKAWESQSRGEECKGGAPIASDTWAALGSWGPGWEGKVEQGQDSSGPGAGCGPKAGCQPGWEVWWLLPGPVLTFDTHTFPLRGNSGRQDSWPGRMEGCSFSFMAKPM